MATVPLSPEFAAQLRAHLPAAAFRPDMTRYLVEPRGRAQGQAGLIVAPATVDEVALVIRMAAAARVGVIPYGGGTGLVLGQVAPDGPLPLVLSLERMNRIRATYPAENVMIAEAGVILADAQAGAADIDRLFPLSLASEGSARIGGVLATNAGGLNVLRYGSARDLCLGLEAVLPDGTIWHGLKRLRKDNTGYDLRGLLIGAEGTLGVITAAALRLYPRPRHEGAALMVVENPSAALDLLAMAQAHAGAGITGFELISGTGLAFLDEALPDIRQPLVTRPAWMVLIGLGLPEDQPPAPIFEAIFDAASSAGIVSDGIIAQSGAQIRDLWAMREAIPAANRRIGAIASHDISLPLSDIPAFLLRAEALIARLGGDMRVNVFGHLGDGNLHYNLFPARARNRADYAAQADGISRALHDLVDEFGGSVSAEHGIGRLKVADLERYADPARLAAMRAIKQALDPLGIMNPGAVLRAG